MTKLFSIMLLAIMVSPVVSFAEDSAATVSTGANIEVTAEGGKPEKYREGGVLNKIKTKIKTKKEKKQKLEALALTPPQVACISDAMKVRDTAQDKVDMDAIAMIKDARWARNEDLTAALSLSGEARIKANVSARKDFQDMVKKTNKWQKDAMNSAGAAFRTTVKDTCKVTSSDQLEVEADSKVSESTS